MCDLSPDCATGCGVGLTVRWSVSAGLLFCSHCICAVDRKTTKEPNKSLKCGILQLPHLTPWSSLAHCRATDLSGEEEDIWVTSWLHYSNDTLMSKQPSCTLSAMVNDENRGREELLLIASSSCDQVALFERKIYIYFSSRQSESTTWSAEMYLFTSAN